jgi:hypothetical protein
MSKCDLEVVLEKADRTFRAGERVRGRVRVTPHGDVECRGLKVTGGWRTHGRGNRDNAPSPFTQTFPVDRFRAGQPQEYPFEFPAPAGPASYHGHLVNVDHYVSAEIDVPWATDPRAEVEVLIPGGDAEPYDFGPKFTTQRRLNSPHAIVPAKKTGCLGGLIGLVIALAGLGVFFFHPVWTFAAAILAVVGIVAFATAKRRVAESRLGTPLVQVQPNPARAGEAVAVTVSFEPPVDVALAGGRIALTAFERAVSGSGTNRTTHTHQIHVWQKELSLGSRRVSARQPVVFQETIAVPADAAPTFMAEDNDVTWAIHVKIALEGWPDWEQEVPLAVRPR